jgi:hypothetical protein
MARWSSTRLLNTLYDEGGTYESIRAVDPCTGESTPDARARAERLSRSRSTTGWPSTIASFGLRYAFGQTGLSAGIERRQFLGSATRQGDVYPASAAVQCRLQLARTRHWKPARWPATAWPAVPVAGCPT